MRKHSLIRRTVTELWVLGKHIVNERGTAAPMSYDEHRILYAFRRNKLGSLPVIQFVHRCKNRGYELGQAVFSLIFFIHLTSAVSNLVESVQTCAHKSIYRQILEIKESHQYFSLTLSMWNIAPGEPT